jgi:O-antigen/teichoic acid export membrane protein
LTITSKTLSDLRSDATLVPQILALVDQGCLSACTFATSALISRTAGLEALGTFSIVWMMILLVNAIQGALVTSPMASLLPSDPRQTVSYFGFYVHVETRFLRALVLASIVVVALTAVSSAANLKLVTCALAALLSYQVYDFVRRCAHVSGRHHAAVLVSAVIAGTQLAMLAILGATGYLTAPSALIAIAIGTGATSIAAALVLVPTPIKDVDDDLMKRSWGISRWLLGSALMQWTCGNLFIFLTPSYIGLSGAGALRAAQSTVGVANIWNQGLENLMPVRAGRLWRDASPRDAVRYVSRVSLVWTLIVGVMVAAVVAYADPLLQALYGPHLTGYGWVLQWYAVLQLLIFFGLPLRSLLRASEHTKGIFLGFVVATVFSVATVIPLLRTYGLVGALLGVTGAQIAFQSVLAWHIWWEFRQLEQGAPLTLTSTHPQVRGLP